MRSTSVLYLTPLVALAAACGTSQVHPSAAAQPIAPRGNGGHSASRLQSSSPRASSSSSKTTTATAPDRCAASQLSLRLGAVGHAAGSAYQPIVFTNTGSASCTLAGYPGVAYVAPGTGKQVGAAAERNSRQPVKTVTLVSGGHASAMVQFVDYLVFPSKQCAASKVSGLRVYAPGETAAAYIAFAATRSACSSDVTQLTVQSVVSGAAGE